MSIVSTLHSQRQNKLLREGREEGSYSHIRTQHTHKHSGRVICRMPHRPYLNEQMKADVETHKFAQTHW